MRRWSTRGLPAMLLMLGGMPAFGQSASAPVPSTMNLHGQAMSGDQASAEGSGNQAVADTSADATTPAKGADSFTAGQATHRIAGHGFSAVSGLAKDPDGVWRGTAMKNGAPVRVWMDYKGSVGVDAS